MLCENIYPDAKSTLLNKLSENSILVSSSSQGVASIEVFAQLSSESAYFLSQQLFALDGEEEGGRGGIDELEF